MIGLILEKLMELGEERVLNNRLCYSKYITSAAIAVVCQ